MLYQTLSLLFVLLSGAMFLCAGIYIGELRMRDKASHLLDDTKRGDQAREELGLYLEWATPDPMSNDEVCRLASRWHTCRRSDDLTPSA